MRFVFLASLALLCLGQAVLASDVLEYHDSDFENKIRQHDVALAEFYAPWCGHCKKLAPEFEIAATSLKENDPPVALIKVDCTVETATCQKYGVSGYPTLKIFKAGEMSDDYNGPRDADGITKYMRTKAGPVAKELHTLADAEKFLAHNEHGVIGFFKNAASTLHTDFKKAADALAESYRFAFSSNPEVLAKYGHEDKVIIYQPPRLQVKLEPIQNIFDGVSNLKSWIEKEIHGIVGHRTGGNAKDFRGPLVVVHYNLDYVRDVKGSNYVRNRIIKVAKKLRDEGIKATFAVSNTDEFKGELAEYGISDVTVDGKYVTGRDAKGGKYKMEGEYSVDALEQFARDLVAGKLEQYLKSEPVPTSNPDAVKTVVAKNFDEIVNDEEKDVLIEFYAPWCGHCKTLAPKYEELAKKLKTETGITIAKMDATANDVPSQYEVRGFPTLFFAPKNNKNSPKKYEGGREIDDFIKYLAKESTEPMVNYDRSGKKLKVKTGDL